MSFISYSLAGDWILAKESEHNPKTLPSQIPTQNTDRFPVVHQYAQHKWKYDYASSRVISRHHGYIWLYRPFEMPRTLLPNERCRIEFDRVSYRAEVYVNGKYIGEHCQSEEPFSFDITDALQENEKNLLAVRVIEPVCGMEAIDGIRLDLIPNGGWAGSETAPTLFPIDSAGGILEEVRLCIVPEVRITDVALLPDRKSGRVDVTVTLQNDTDRPATVSVDIRFAYAKNSKTVSYAKSTVVAEVGESTLSLSATVQNPEPWELGCPTLYTAEIRTDSASARTVRFGFRDILVRDGFFFLNDKRILLRCAHGTPSAEVILQMKALGFNAFRSIQHLLPPEVLDLCDEIGMMIIESPLTSWGMRLHESTQAMIESSLCNMVRMHRNHPCIFAFYLFNELKNTTILRYGMDTLPRLRALAPNALLLLSSGRWDFLYEEGSVSNPYSNRWEPLWGHEGDGREISHNYPSRFLAPANLGMGDLHPYPYVPLDREARKWFASVGTTDGSKPVFLSECGIGSHENPERCYYERLSLGMREGSDSIREIQKVYTDLCNFLTHYGMESICAHPTDICRWADRENARHREVLLSCLRSNPMLCGFSLTSFGTGNEGMQEGIGVLKEDLAYVLQTGLAPLRWSLTASESVLYENRPFEIRAVLCNEDILPPGTYAASAAILGRDGIVWRKSFQMVYPERGYGALPPLAAEAFTEELTLAQGEYTLSVRLLEGGAPYAEQLRLRVVAPHPSRDISHLSVATLGLAEATRDYLAHQDIQTVSFTGTTTADTVFLGAPEGMNAEKWEELFTFIENGGRAVFLNSEIFATEEAEPYLKRIAGEGAKCPAVKDWLYHYDSLHIPHPLFYNINDIGLLNIDTLFELYPRYLFKGTDKADLTVCASLRMDGGQCATSLTVGEYRIGAGCAVLNGFRIEQALHHNPYADQLLLNFITHYGAK